MPQFKTDFSTATVGQAPAGWTLRWTTGTETWTTVSLTKANGAISDRVAQYSNTTDNMRRFISYDAVGTYTGDWEILCKFRNSVKTDADISFRVGAEIRGTNAVNVTTQNTTHYGYMADLYNGTGLVVDTYRIQEYNGAGSLVTATDPNAIDIPANSWAWMKFKRVGSGTNATITMRMWLDGTPEPTTWNVTFIDNPVDTILTTAGWFGVGFYDISGTKQIAYFSVGTGAGVEAPNPLPALKASLDVNTGVKADLSVIPAVTGNAIDLTADPIKAITKSTLNLSIVNPTAHALAASLKVVTKIVAGVTVTAPAPVTLSGTVKAKTGKVAALLTTAPPPVTLAASLKAVTRIAADLTKTIPVAHALAGTIKGRSGLLAGATVTPPPPVTLVATIKARSTLTADLAKQVPLAIALAGTVKARTGITADIGKILPQAKDLAGTVKARSGIVAALAAVSPPPVTLSATLKAVTRVAATLDKVAPLAIPLAGSVKAVSKLLTTPLSKAIPIAAQDTKAVTKISAVNLINQIALKASAMSKSKVTAGINIGVGLGANLKAVTGIKTPVLYKDMPLAARLGAKTAVKGTIEAYSAFTLNGYVKALSKVTGRLNAALTLKADLKAVTKLSPVNINKAIPLTISIKADVLLRADLYIKDQTGIAGIVKAKTAISAPLAKEVPLTASLKSLSKLTAPLIKAIPLAASLPTRSGVTASLSVQAAAVGVGLSGTVKARSKTAAALISAVSLNGYVKAKTAVSAPQVNKLITLQAQPIKAVSDQSATLAAIIALSGQIRAKSGKQASLGIGHLIALLADAVHARAGIHGEIRVSAFVEHIDRCVEILTSLEAVADISTAIDVIRQLETSLDALAAIDRAIISRPTQIELDRSTDVIIGGLDDAC